MDENKTSVFWNPDGYVEMTLIGTVTGQDLRDLVESAKTVVEQNRPAGGLIDGRRGNITRDVESLRTLRHIGEIKGLQRLVILTTKDNPAGIRGPTVVMAMLTSIFGFRPLYISDETEARQCAAEPL